MKNNFVSFVFFVDKPLFKAFVHEKHENHEQEQKQKIKTDVRRMRRAPPFVPDIYHPNKQPLMQNGSNLFHFNSNGGYGFIRSVTGDGFVMIVV